MCNEVYNIAVSTEVLRIKVTLWKWWITMNYVKNMRYHMWNLQCFHLYDIWALRCDHWTWKCTRIWTSDHKPVNLSWFLAIVVKIDYEQWWRARSTNLHKLDQSLDRTFSSDTRPIRSNHRREHTNNFFSNQFKMVHTIAAGNSNNVTLTLFVQAQNVRNFLEFLGIWSLSKIICCSKLCK